MLLLAPPEKLSALPAFPGWSETAQERRDRYYEIAYAISRVVSDPREAPVDGGPNGRLNAAALLVSVSFFESGWAPDVDIGPCYRNADGKGSRCDGGRSATIFQINVGAGSTAEGWSREELFADREKAARAALHKINRSIKACSRFGREARLRQYASGSCEHGIPESTARVGLARKLLREHPFLAPRAALLAPPVITLIPESPYALFEARL